MIAVVNIDCFHYIMVLVGEDGVNIQINLFQSEDAFRKQRVKIPDVSALPSCGGSFSRAEPDSLGTKPLAEVKIKTVTIC